MTKLDFNVVASLEVSFSGGGAGLSAEIDNRPNGPNLGYTAFGPGDSVYFLVHTTGGAIIDEVISSAGSVGYDGPVTYDIFLERVVFANTNVAMLAHEPRQNLSNVVVSDESGSFVTLGPNIWAMHPGVVSLQWQGFDPGPVSVAGRTLSVDRRVALWIGNGALSPNASDYPPNRFVAVALATYSTTAYQYHVVAPDNVNGSEVFDLSIQVIGHDPNY